MRCGYHDGHSSSYSHKKSSAVDIVFVKAPFCQVSESCLLVVSSNEPLKRKDFVPPFRLPGSTLFGPAGRLEGGSQCQGLPQRAVSVSQRYFGAYYGHLAHSFCWAQSGMESFGTCCLSIYR